MTGRRITKALLIGTYVYLGLPYVVFFAGWIRQPYALLLIIMLLAGLSKLFQTQRSPGADIDQGGDFSAADAAKFLIPVAAVMLIAGVGGWGFQYGDWAKHNSIFRDLVNESWPVFYDLGNHQVMLTYYMAHQLPAALAGKLFGWQAANHVLFIYTFFGLCLSALWIRLLTGIRWWWLFIVFLAFSGMDVIGQIVSTAYQQGSIAGTIESLTDTAVNDQHLEWWSGWGFAQYSSIAALIFLVPNQAIAGWLLTAMILKDARDGTLVGTGIFYIGICSLWAPFVGLGLIPLLLFAVIWISPKQPRLSATVTEMMSWPNVAGVVIGLVAAVYFLGRFEDFVMPIDLSSVAYEEKITFTFLRSPWLFVPRYLMFVLLEFALLHAVLFVYIGCQQRHEYREEFRLLVFASIFLLLLPLLNWGWNNEPSMRSSIPAIFITFLVLIRVLATNADSSGSLWAKRAILAVFLVGSLNAMFEVGRQVTMTAQRGSLVEIPSESDIETIFEIQDRNYRELHNFAGQYVGSPDSIFARYLARP